MSEVKLEVNLYKSFKPVFEHLDKNIDAYNEIVRKELVLKDEVINLETEEKNPALKAVSYYLLASPEEITILLVDEKRLKDDSKSPLSKSLLEIGKKVALLSISAKHEVINSKED